MEKNVKGVVLIMHGLNLKPQKMDGWAEVLDKNGFLTIRGELSGHNGNKYLMKNVSKEKWQEDFLNQALLAKSKAKELNVPLYFLGFSLGALLGVDYQSKYAYFQKMVLIAPAVAVPWYATMVRALFFLGKGTILPSRSPKEYQATSGTSLFAYEALLEIKNDLEKNCYKNTNINSLVIMDLHDELVPFKKLREIIEKHHLNKWQINLFNNKYAHDNFGFRHLVVDKSSVGDKEWENITKKVIEFLMS